MISKKLLLLFLVPATLSFADSAEEKKKIPLIVAKGVFNSAETFQAQSGIDEFFHQDQREIFFAVTPRGETIERRGEILIQEIERLVPQGPYHLVGVSMGGLDSRYALSHSAKTAKRCLSLTTIASPHHGSPIASMAQFFLGWTLPLTEKLWPSASQAPLMVRLLQSAQVLTVKSVTEDFNTTHPNVPGVHYSSISTGIHPQWIPFDGLVSTQSAQWGLHLGTVKAHHMKAVFESNILDPKEPARETWKILLKQIENAEASCEEKCRYD